MVASCTTAAIKDSSSAKPLMHSHKWMIKCGGVVRCGRACCLCFATPEPIWLLERCCVAWDILHDPLEAPGVVDPCPWVWHPQSCVCWPCFCRLHLSHKVRALPVLDFPEKISGCCNCTASHQQRLERHQNVLLVALPSASNSWWQLPLCLHRLHIW